jgi:hypothetical protein
MIPDTTLWKVVRQSVPVQGQLLPMYNIHSAVTDRLIAPNLSESDAAQIVDEHNSLIGRADTLRRLSGAIPARVPPTRQHP